MDKGMKNKRKIREKRDQKQNQMFYSSASALWSWETETNFY
jgi:hypothetical protein